MIFLLGVLLRVAVLSVFVLLPGVAILRWSGFRARRAVDYLLALASTGIGAVVVVGYVLLFMGLYSRPAVLLLLVVAPLVYLLRQRHLGRALLEWRLPAEVASPELTWPDRAALAAVGLYLVLVFLEACTSPVTNWDALVSWDRWATQWARRGSFLLFPSGGYPQTVPILGSLLYLLFGTWDRVLPVEQFAWHGAQALLASGLVASLARLAQLLRIAVWPVCLLPLVSDTFVRHVTAANAETALMFLAAAPLVLLLAESAGEARYERGRAWLLGLQLFGALFTKFFGLLMVPLAGALARRSAQRWSWRELAIAVTVPLAFSAGFQLYQLSISTIPAARLEPGGAYYQSSKLSDTLAHVQATSYEGKGGHTLAATTWRFLADYQLGEGLARPFGMLLAACLAAALFSRAVRPFAWAFLLAYAAWSLFVSYDIRNLQFAMPWLAVSVAGGGALLMRAAARWRAMTWAATAVAGLFVATVAGRLPVLMDSVVTPLFGSPKHSSLAGRLRAIEQGPAAVTLYHWPDYREIFGKLHALPATRQALLATNTALFRLFPRTIYTSSHYSPTWLRPGDLYVGGWGREPPDYDDWTLVLVEHPFKVWVNQKDARRIPLSAVALTGFSPPTKAADAKDDRLVLDVGGPESRIVWNVPERDLQAGDCVVWRVVVEATQPDSHARTDLQAYDRSIVRPEATFLARDDSRLPEHRIAYAGLLTFRSGNLSRDSGQDGILVGLNAAGHARPLVVTEFRVSVFRLQARSAR